MNKQRNVERSKVRRCQSPLVLKSNDKNLSSEKVEESLHSAAKKEFPGYRKEWENTGNGAWPKCLPFAKNPLTARRLNCSEQ